MLCFSTTMDSTLEALEAAHDSVDRFVHEAGFGEFDTNFIVLAVHEILVNAMKHGNHFDSDKKVDLSLSTDETGLHVEIRDQGAGFNLDGVPDPRLPENLGRASGRGLTLARGIMDHLNVQVIASGGTCVRMSKLFSSRTAEIGG